MSNVNLIKDVYTYQELINNVKKGSCCHIFRCFSYLIDTFRFENSQPQ